MNQESSRICSKCGICKQNDLFVQRDNKPMRTCKSCKRDYDKKYREKNAEKIKKRYDEIKESSEYKKKNRERAREWKLRNPEKHKNLKRRRRKQETEWMKRFYLKKIKEKDTAWIIKDRLRKRMSVFVRSRTSSFSELIGCEPGDLVRYLESKFKDGMSWENYGRKGWHIDHIIPLSKFDLKKEKELRKACHYSNLQPLWAFENLSKGAK